LDIEIPAALSRREGGQAATKVQPGPFFLAPIKRAMVMRRVISNLWNDESGISSVEYALLLAFVTAGIIIGAEVLSDAIGNELGDAAGCIEDAVVC